MRAPASAFVRLASILLMSCCTAPVAAGPAVLSADQEAALETGSAFTECVDCPEMVVVPAGAFLMGSEAAAVRRCVAARLVAADREGPQ